MYKSISQVVSDAIEPLHAGGEIDVRVEADKAINWLDTQDKEYLAQDALARKITDAAKKMSKRAVEQIGSATLGLFVDMPPAVPINTDGRRIKAVMSLTQAEAAWVIQMREKQVAADTKSVRNFKRHYMSALPYWESNPERTWASCLKAADVRRPQKRAA